MSIGHAAERIAAARRGRAALGFPFMLTGRAENHIRGNPDLDDTIARLQAYEEAGADVLYAPGLRTRGRDPRGVRGGLEAGQRARAPGLTMAEIVEAGAQRISVGGWLAWIAVGAMAEAAERIRDQGDFSVLHAQVRMQEWLGDAR